MHHHRAEHWVVVSGTARITRGEEEFLLEENQSTYIPIGVKHRIENPGMIPLEIIEVQSGSYLGEDDIVRFEDRYGRQGTNKLSARMSKLDSFKAYDIRGRIPDELNEALAYDIGRAYAAFVKPKRVAVGYDIRLSSPQLAAALKRGLMDCGSDVLDIGLCGTEGAYFATFAEGLDGGIMVTASHNPPDYNGMKFVREERAPDQSATPGCFDMRAPDRSAGKLPGQGGAARHRAAARHQPQVPRAPAGLCRRAKLRPLKVVVNAGNGGAGLIVDQLEPHLPFEFIKVNHEPDGTFPHGVPNPMLEENRAATADVVRAHRRRRGPGLGRRLRPLLLLRRDTGSSSRATTSSACWPRPSCGGARRAHRARPAPHLEHHRHRAPLRRQRRCCASPATPSSSRRCARSTPSTAAR